MHVHGPHKKCCFCSECVLALEIYKQLLEDKCKPNLVTYNILIDAYNKTGQLEKSIETLKEIKAHDMIPEARTYNSIISFCGKACQGELALRVYNIMLDDGVSPTSTTFTSAISACGRAGMVEKALCLYGSMSKMGCQPNVITFSSLISVCERSAKENLALQLLDDMRKVNVAPNIVTYNGLLGTFARCSSWQRATATFQELISVGLTPDSTTYSALVSALSMGNQWKLALEYAEKAQSLGLRIESGAYLSMLGCLWASGRLSAQRKALRLLSAANKNGTIKIQFNVAAESTVAADTAAACCLVTIKWLSEFQLGLLGASLYNQPVRVLNFSQGKYWPVDSCKENIGETLKSFLESYGVPASVSMSNKGLTIKANTRLMPSWASAGSGYLLMSIADIESGGAQSSFSMLKEDNIVFSQCKKAYNAVRSFEDSQSAFWSQNGKDSNFLVNEDARIYRQLVIEYIISLAVALQLREEISHDAIQLSDRLLMLGIPNQQPPAHACSAALLLMACRQAGSAHLILKNEQVVQQTAGLPTSVILEAENWVSKTLGSAPSAISPLRVLNLYFERLGYDSTVVEKHQVLNIVVMNATDLVARAAISPSFTAFPPSLVAAASLSVAFSRMLHVPSWPTAVKDLTKYTEEDEIMRRCCAMIHTL